jgi:hypothetical protein
MKNGAPQRGQGYRLSRIVAHAAQTNKNGAGTHQNPAISAWVGKARGRPKTVIHPRSAIHAAFRRLRYSLQSRRLRPTVLSLRVFAPASWAHLTNPSPFKAVGSALSVNVLRVPTWPCTDFADPPISRQNICSVHPPDTARGHVPRSERSERRRHPVVMRSATHRTLSVSRKSGPACPP